MKTIELTEVEFKIIARMVYKYAKMEREDIIGAILKTEGFRELSNEGSSVVKLSDKIQHYIQTDINEEIIQEIIE